MPEYNTHQNRAISMLHGNNYLTIATCNLEKEPWSAIVMYAYDKDFNMYFLSAVDSRHAKDIIANPNVSFSVFDSRQPVGESEAIQAEGKAALVEGKELKKALDIYVKKLSAYPGILPEGGTSIRGYAEPAEFRFFKIKISKLFVTGEDRRIEVDLKGQ